MSKFTVAHYHDLLGVSPVSQVSDQDIWRNLISPITRSLLGPVVRVRPPVVLETTEGLFPQDVGSNLNDHWMYGGRDGFVRFPYVSNVYETKNGLLIIKRDLIKFEVFAWLGKVYEGKGELIFKAGMRDRRFDGTRRANDSALLDFTYDNPIFHHPLSDTLRSAEFSIYTFMVGSSIKDASGDDEFEEFVRQPFVFLDRPELFLKYFEMAWKSKRAPGQYAAPIADVSQLLLRGFKRIACDLGYDLLEMAPSHYHVARWGLAGGYRFAYRVQKDSFEAMQKGIEGLMAKGARLSRSQQSWVCVIQSLRPGCLIPEEINLDGPVWPQDNISDQCLWLYKNLSKRARGFVPECYEHKLKSPEFDCK